MLATYRSTMAALAKVQASHPDVRVLLITGYTGPTEEVVHLPRLSKPFGRTEIADALVSVLDDSTVVRFPSEKAKRGS